MPTAALTGQFFRFCLVGGVGFVVDAGSLWLLIDFGSMGLLSGRVVSYLIAATVTWALHRHFHHSPMGAIAQRAASGSGSSW